jgi:putative ABC transport system ATP-binding protein
MPKITCPRCNQEIESWGVTTVCPHCQADLREQLAEAERVIVEKTAIVRDESATTHEFIVRTRGLTKIYRMGEVEVPALRGVDLDVRRGEYLSIMGPSGSGKSTLFNMIGGLDKPTSGSCFIDEVDLAQLTAFELAWLRCRKIGYIFQTFNLIPVMTALENVTLPMIFAGMSTDEMMERGRMLLELVGLGDRLHHKPYELSGGQQQRVAVARALANSPAIILADEPTGNLDLATGKEIIALLKELNVSSGVTIISATHDLKMIDVSDRIVHIRDGQIERIEHRSEIELQVGRLGDEEAG